jgi:hypothetical protein
MLSVMKAKRISFLVLALVALESGRAMAADVELVHVAKGRVYSQTNAAAAQPLTQSYVFELRVQATAPNNALRNVWFQTPAPPAGFWRFLQRFGGSQWWQALGRGSSQTQVDNQYRNGDYLVWLDTVHEGHRTNRLNLAAASPPNAPVVQNLASALRLDPAHDFTVQWDSFAGGSASDLVTLMVLEAGSPAPVFETPPRVGVPGALSGPATSVTIPAGRLSPGRAYLGRLRFDRILSLDITTYPGVTAMAGTFAATDFPIRTLGADPDTAPRLAQVRPAAGSGGIKQDAPMVFTFSKPMRSSFSYSISGTTNGFTAVWSTDRRQLVLVPNTPLAAGSSITWTLQPWGPYPLFGDPEGNPLFGEVIGNFVVGTGLLPAPTPPQLAILRASGDPPTVVLSGDGDRLHVLECSTNLISWQPCSTNVPVDGSAIISDSRPMRPEQRFYRGRLWP